jgi:[acyl-carrier-protein] S-malonyltransferase
MGKAWYDHSPAARRVFDDADGVLGDQLSAPLTTLCFEGPAEILNQTNVSQPALYTCSVACYRAMEEEDPGRDLIAVAGLSLGEYTALHLGGVFSFEAGLRLVTKRGRLMQDAAESKGGTMVVIIGADADQVTALCSDVLASAGEGEVLVLANDNAPGQIVLSGTEHACGQACELAAERGLRATPLTVAGAFHSPLMDPAAEKMGQALAQETFADPSCPVWSNVTAKPHEEGNPELIRQRLVEQITHPVRWAQTALALSNLDATFEEVAPGSVLRGLMRRVNRKVKVASHDQPPAPVDS